MESLSAVAALLESSVGTVFPAAQLVVVDGGEVRASLAAGACQPQTRFDLASLTKPLATCALALRLAGNGALSLDDRPRPECTLAQLLAHAGGLPAVRALGDPDRPSPEMRVAAVESARTAALEVAPGARSTYSDLGFILIGDAIERATGERLDALFAREVAGPLGLDLRFGPVDGDVAPTEHGLRGVVHDDNARAMGGVAGHAGLFGNAAEVSRAVAAWVDAWHGDHERFLPPALVRRAFANAGVPGSTWGLGWDHPSPEGSSAGARWPRDGVGHLAFTGCSIWIDPPRRRWVVLVSNRVCPTRANEAIRAFRPRLHDAVVAALG